MANTNNDTRISKVRNYLFDIISNIRKINQINANYLSGEKDNYSLDKIPTEKKVRPNILGGGLYRQVYSFRGRLAYGQTSSTNFEIMGFFEKFEDIIESNNNKGILPDIEGIDSIECLDCASVNNTQTNTAEFDIQIQITYLDDGKYDPSVSL